MEVFVWVDCWQQQCCGEEFRLGSKVQWQVSRKAVPDEWISRLLGSEWAEKVEFIEDHHLEQADGVLTGFVSSINVVTCDRVIAQARTPEPTGQVMMPVPGSARLRSVDVADPWEPEPHHHAGWSFDGWIINLKQARYELGAPQPTPS